MVSWQDLVSFLYQLYLNQNNFDNIYKYIKNSIEQHGQQFL